MSYHYTKSGNLDMRYSSSRSYVASGGSSSGPSSGGGGSSSSYGGGGGRSSYTSGSTSGYSGSGGGSSSSSNYYSSGGVGGGGTSSSASDGLHYTKSGNLDMRYSSSKAAAASYESSSSYAAPARARASYTPSSSTSASDLHYTKSGNLDMRFSSSKAAASGASGSNSSASTVKPARHSYTPSTGSSDVHYTKSGTLDMRFTSSKALMNNMMDKLKINEEAEPSYTSSRSSGGALPGRGRSIPQNVPTTKQGLPDMRFKAAKDWVAAQSLGFTDQGALPQWLPKMKDGRVDMHKNVVKAFFDPSKGTSASQRQKLPPYNPEARRNYYRRRYEEEEYRRVLTETRDRVINEQVIRIPTSDQLRSLRESMQTILAAPVPRKFSNGLCFHDQPTEVILPSNVKTVNFDDIKQYCVESRKLGTGGFGTVYKGRWDSKRVAIKKLLMDSLGKAGKAQFIKEVTIMSIFTDHTNLVQMFGYSLEPACVIVMEYVELGSLSWLIHHCEDAAVEAKISDGRIKKRLASGIVSGMIQLHSAEIIHRDLKPQNVLVTEDYTAKIADFGFSSLRGRTASLMGTNAFAADDDILAGTAAYMAPELIDGDAKVTPGADVYAFGVVMNEIVHEEEPYSESFADLHARGPFGAALLAKSGKRPMLNKDLVPANVKELIEACWDADPAKRPGFVQVAKLLNKPEMKFPDYKF